MRTMTFGPLSMLLLGIVVLAYSGGAPLDLPPACGQVGYRGGVVGWSAERQEQGVFSSDLELEPCGSDGGGWRCAVHDDLAQISDGSRPAAAVDAGDLVALRAFESTYRNRKPLLIRATSGNHAWLGKGKKAEATRHRLSRSALLKNAGSRTANVGLSHDIITFGGKGYLNFSLSQYIDFFMPSHTQWDTLKGEPFYIFHRANLADTETDWGGPLSSMLVPLEGTQLFGAINKSEHHAVWLIGPPRSGAIWHDHTEAWAAVAYGRKRWLFFPPEVSPPAGGDGPNVWPQFGIADWLDQVLPLLPPTMRPIEIVQNPGDLMYIPEGWSHATLNIDDVVSVSFQRRNPVDASGEFAKRSRLTGLLEDSTSLAERLEAVALHPCRNDLRYLVADALRIEGRELEAANQYKEVLKLDPLFGPAAVGLARVLIGIGNHSGAVQALKDIITKVPANRQLRGMYEQILTQAGLHTDPLYMRGDLKDMLAYKNAQFNAYALVPQPVLERDTQTPRENLINGDDDTGTFQHTLQVTESFERLASRAPMPRSASRQRKTKARQRRKQAKQAKEAGVFMDTIDVAIEEVVDRGHAPVDALATGKRDSENKATTTSTENSLRDANFAVDNAQLASLSIGQLRKHALAASIDEMLVDDAFDSANPKDTLVELLIAALEEKRTQAIHESSSDFAQMSLGQLRRRALADGIHEHKIDDAMDADHPKVAIATLLSRSKSDSEEELHGLTLRQLRRRGLESEKDIVS